MITTAQGHTWSPIWFGNWPLFEVEVQAAGTPLWIRAWCFPCPPRALTQKVTDWEASVGAYLGYREGPFLGY